MKDITKSINKNLVSRFREHQIIFTLDKLNASFSGQLWCDSLKKIKGTFATSKKLLLNQILTLSRSCFYEHQITILS